MTIAAHTAGLLPNSQRLFLVFCPRTKLCPRKVLCIKVISSMTSLPWELTQASEVNLIIFGSRHNNYEQTVTSYTSINLYLSLWHVFPDEFMCWKDFVTADKVCVCDFDAGHFNSSKSLSTVRLLGNTGNWLPRHCSWWFGSAKAVSKELPTFQ